jgi:ERCC4-type nuclease
MVKIQVDMRENDLIKIMENLIETIPSFKELELKIENLPLGDIILSDEKEEYVIIERKSVNDLMASIKDGRYEEQSYRLNGLQNHANHNVIYLIEGDVNRLNRFKDNRVDKLTLYSAIFSLNFTKGFSVIRTFSLEETAIFLCNSGAKLRKILLENKKPYYPNNSCKNTNVIDVIDVIEEKSQEDASKDYINVVKKNKKENITPDNIAEIMLTQIPGISTVTALAIMKEFPSFSELLLALKENNECLKNISYQTEKGQTRKINKTCLENLQKYLLKKNI